MMRSRRVRSVHSIVVLLLVSGAHLAPSQAPATIRPQHAAGCFDLSYGAQSGASRLLGRMVLDTAIAHSRIDPGGFRLRFVEGFGTTGVLPGGTWRRGAGDSLFVTLVGRDNHTRFGFPRLGADTLRGWARFFGLGPDTVSTVPALAIRRTPC
jgi:hypothetical protein